MSRFFPVSQPWIGEREMRSGYRCRPLWLGVVDRRIHRALRTNVRRVLLALAMRFRRRKQRYDRFVLHLALACLGIKSGDEVIIPDLTFIATANAVAYTGATVVPVDIDGRSLCMDPDAFEKAITSRGLVPSSQCTFMAIPREWKRSQRSPTRTELRSWRMPPRPTARKSVSAKSVHLEMRNFQLLWKQSHTSGEGGMLTTNDREIFQKARYLRDHAMSAERRYWHTEVGFNYRMTNLQAALGVAQMERIEQFIEKRGQLMEWYRRGLAGISKLRLNYDEPGVKSVYWMVCVEIEGIEETKRAEIMVRLKTEGVDTRP